jgi:hypothetical protein
LGLKEEITSCANGNDGKNSKSLAFELVRKIWIELVLGYI